MKRFYADDITGRENVLRLPVEPLRRPSLPTILERRWDQLRPSHQLGVLLPVAIGLTALTIEVLS